MRDIRILVLCAAVVSFSALGAEAADLAVNGVVVPRAKSSHDVTQEITEFRSGGSPVISLVPGSKRYNVCIEARDPVAVLDSELPVADTPNRFAVTVEDGREFKQCLLANHVAGGRKRRFTYCLQCEDVQNPGP